jgi:hypothetical protein
MLQPIMNCIRKELVMVDNYRTTEVDISLAYKFVYAAEPLSRADIYVDATNGKFF